MKHKRRHCRGWVRSERVLKVAIQKFRGGSRAHSAIKVAKDLSFRNENQRATVGTKERDALLLEVNQRT